jgi:hypothetical protein
MQVMKKLVFIVLLFSCSFLWGQKSDLSTPYHGLDSLWALYYNTSQADTNRLNAIHLIARSYTSNKSDTAIILAEQERQLAISTKQKKFEARALL